MLKSIAAICLSATMLFGFYPTENREANKHTTDNATAIATCYGKTPCTACSNCSACKYCKGGGTCGKCAKTDNTYKSKAPTAASSASAQCKATTKKGTRCKRGAENRGYCWQHG